MQEPQPGVWWWDKGLQETREGVLPIQWAECLKRALLRVSLSVNHRAIDGTEAALAQDDDQLSSWLESKGISPASLYRYSEERTERDQEAPFDELEFDQFFYGQLELYASRVLKARCLLRQMTTGTFLQTTFDTLRCEYSKASMGFETTENPNRLGRIVGTNYLVKNIWHNYVHVYLHGINHANYREFSGTGRYQTDFEADNLATVLLARAYGLPTRSDSLDDTYSPNGAVVSLLRRNRCNRAFEERSRNRPGTVETAGFV